MNRLGDTSAFVIPAGQLLLTRQGKTIMYTVGIVMNYIQCPFNRCESDAKSDQSIPIGVVSIHVSVCCIYLHARQSFT